MKIPLLVFMSEIKINLTPEKKSFSFLLKCEKITYFSPSAVATKIKNIKLSSFKSSENIQKKEGGPDRSFSDNQSSSVTLNELAMKARKNCYFEFQQGSHTLTDINLNGVQIIKTVQNNMDLNL